MGLLTGMFFGFLLQKARVVRYDKQIGGTALSGHDHNQIHDVCHYCRHGGHSFL